MKNTRLIIVAAVLAVLLSPAFALANGDSNVGYRGWGPRVGLSIDPDQIYFGAHMDFGNFSRHVRFQPNIELGVGNNMTLLAINAEAAYRFSSNWEVWTPYLGGGLGVNVASYDGAGSNNSHSDLGVNFLGGIEKGRRDGGRFFIELKLGLNDSPDAKIGIGWTFY